MLGTTETHAVVRFSWGPSLLKKYLRDGPAFDEFGQAGYLFQSSVGWGGLIHCPVRRIIRKVSVNSKVSSRYSL